MASPDVLYGLQGQILERLRDKMAQPVSRGSIPSSKTLVRTEGRLDPYMVCVFSQPTLSTQGRSLGGPRLDSKVGYVDVYCVSDNADITARLNATARNVLLGFNLDGGGRLANYFGNIMFDITDSSLKPTVYVERSSFIFTINRFDAPVD